MQTLIILTIKYWKILITFTLITFITAITVLVVAAKPAYQTTVLMTVGANMVGSGETSTYELLQSADFFSETIMGWMKNPKLVSSLKKEIAAKKQEKQNLVLSFSTATEQEANDLLKKLETELTEMMGNYNRLNSSSYTLTAFDASISENRISIMLIIIASFSGGLISAYMLVYLFESIRKNLSAIKK